MLEFKGRVGRRVLFAGAAAMISPIMGVRSARAAATLRISYQKSSILLQVARQRNMIDLHLRDIGFEPEWSVLSTAPAQIGTVDYVSDVAEAVPVTVLPLFPSLALYAAEGPSPKALGIIVHKESGITSAADLRGRRIAVGKTGSAFDFLLLTLDAVGLHLSDVHPIYIPESACIQAFNNGAIDGWATFDPYFSFATALPNAVLLADGTSAGMRYNRYYMADIAFARAYPQTVSAMREILGDAAAWVRGNPGATADLLSRQWDDMPLDIVRKVLSHRNFEVRPPDATDLETLQDINDRYAKQGLVPMGRNLKMTPLLS
ncbi:ABC transporter substrate-binding protein [Acetobacter persici]|uniref:ABC transporter substrate-binding protein n=1 Tax=Acetobacter persici TaxID=1076596 RepID=UPI001BAA2D32|nr:ABC transporter substrate-binding protein [Acetobacter persici]MBS0964398.1 ABC transporter substrate-binding protein [Acetobacter persici]